MAFLTNLPDSPRGTARRVAGVLLALAAFAGLVLLLYATLTHLYAGGSDMATTILEGQALGRGNLLLHGWILTRDSFWTTDALVFGLAVGADGVRPSLLDLGPAVVVAITIVVGALVARQGRRGAAAVAGAAAVVVLLALPTPAMALSLFTPHVGTALLALVAFTGLRQASWDWRWAMAVAVLAAGMAGDLLIVAYGIVPIFVAGVVCMLRERAWRAGMAAVSASVAATIVGVLTSWFARAIGGFTLGPEAGLASFHQMLANLRGVWTYGAGFLGLTDFFGTGGVPSALEDVHFVGAVLVVACSLVAMSNLVREVLRGHREPSLTSSESESRWLDNVLFVAMFGPAVSFVLLATAGPTGDRYLVATVVFAGVLTGRIVARTWERLTTGAIRAICVVGAAVSLCYGAGLGYTLSQPVPIQSAAALSVWLEAHHLRNGVGGYWAASITTVESRGAITVRPVLRHRDGRLGPSMYESSASWYAGQHFQFLVYETPPYQGVDGLSAVKTWGRPAHTYVVGKYRVLVWSVAFSFAPLTSSR